MPFRVRPFRDRLLNRLVKRAPLEELGQGAVPIRAADPASDVVLVREGHLQLELARPSTERRAVDVVLPWEVTGTEAVLRAGLYRWDAVAPAPAVVQRLPGSEVRRVLQRAEGTLDAFLLASRERLALARLLGHGATGTTAAQRLGLLLLHLGGRAVRPDPRDTDPGPPEGRGGPLDLPFRITHRALGEMAGLHRSTVTTLLNDWLYRDLLEDREPGWRIPDPETFLREISPR
ncbi:MAG: helix-turn-helix domain-containing protein [Gemmatimonadota bacterium]|jgi:CRP-like cAMP-binding protein